MSETLRYAAAACQTDQLNPLTARPCAPIRSVLVDMIDAAVAGSAPFLPVRLVVFPEFAHAAPVYSATADLRTHLTVPIPNEHTERLVAKAREHDIYIQSGSMLEEDPAYLGRSSTRRVSSDRRESCRSTARSIRGSLRSAHEPARHPRLRGADVSRCRHADRASGLRDLLRLAVSRSHPPAFANGAEVLVRVSAYMDPWGD